jgi:hypothetical protein
VTSKFSTLPFAGLVLSIAAALLLCLTSLIGILAPEWAYPTTDLQMSLVPNDIVNLLVGLPFLAAMVWLALRGRLWARLCWPGAFLYFIYNSLVAVASLRPGLLVIAHFMQIIVSLAAVFLLLRRAEKLDLSFQCKGCAAAKLAGIIMAIMGMLFLLRAIGLIVHPPSSDYFSSVEFKVSLADLAFAPVWIFYGVSLTLQKPAGYIGGSACLSQFGVLFVGLLLVMYIQSAQTQTPLQTADILVILAMSLIVLIPSALFFTGLEKNRKI